MLLTYVEDNSRALGLRGAGLRGIGESAAVTLGKLGPDFLEVGSSGGHRSSFRSWSSRDQKSASAEGEGKAQIGIQVNHVEEKSGKGWERKKKEGRKEFVDK